MKPPSDPGIVIAHRTFDNQQGKIELSIHQPAPDPSPHDADPENPGWRCWYTIRFPDGETQQRGIMGVDGVQALLLAFASAKGALDYVGDGTPTRRPTTTWLGQSDLGLTINHFE
jgi:hypothetical protein